MAMPRPSEEAQKIAMQVVPGLARHARKAKSSRKQVPRASMSRVEVIQTNNIENKEGLR